MNPNYLWPVVIIGPKTQEHLIEIQGDHFIASVGSAGKILLYDCQMLRDATNLYHRVPVNDGHYWYGKRYHESIGRIVHPFWDDENHCVKGYVEITNGFWQEYLEEQAVKRRIENVSLSHDIEYVSLSLPLVEGGKKYEFVGSIRKIYAVDVVSEGRTGGRFLPILYKKPQRKRRTQQLLTVKQAEQIATKIAEAFMPIRDEWMMIHPFVSLRITEGSKATRPMVWDVVIIGANNPDDIVSVQGKQYIRSKNNRFYDLQLLKDTVHIWDNVKVFDNHLTNAEFQARAGMRSVVKEWIGSIVKPRWDHNAKAIKGTLKIVDEKLAKKLFYAWECGILNTIGLSIDASVIPGPAVAGRPTVAGFSKILSVDLVAEPALGGRFNQPMN